MRRTRQEWTPVFFFFFFLLFFFFFFFFQILDLGFHIKYGKKRPKNGTFVFSVNK